MDRHVVTAAAIGGVFVGVIGAIPVLSLGNVCCCLWAWLGAFLAIRLYSKATGLACSARRALLIGAMTGAIGGIVWPVTFVGLNLTGISGFGQNFQAAAQQFDFTPVLGNVSPEQRAFVEQKLNDFKAMSPSSAVAHFTAYFAPLFFVVLVVVCSLAGLVGALLFASDGPTESSDSAAGGPSPAL